MIVLCDDDDVPALAAAMAGADTGPVLLECIDGQGWRAEFLQQTPAAVVEPLLGQGILRPWTI